MQRCLLAVTSHSPLCALKGRAPPWRGLTPTTPHTPRPQTPPRWPLGLRDLSVGRTVQFITTGYTCETRQSLLPLPPPPPSPLGTRRGTSDQPLDRRAGPGPSSPLATTGVRRVLPPPPDQAPLSLRQPACWVWPTASPQGLLDSGPRAGRGGGPGPPGLSLPHEVPERTDV